MNTNYLLTLIPLRGTRALTRVLGVAALGAACFVPAVQAANPWTLWWERSDSSVALWSMDNTNLQRASYLHPNKVGSGWRLKGSADLNHDGSAEVLWQHDDGRVGRWRMDHTNCTEAGLLNPPVVNTNWCIAGTTDLNGDGRPDILWQHTDGWVAGWFMDDTNCTGAVLLNPARVGPGWHIAGVADLNGDGKPDIIWQHKDGSVGAWLMDGGTNCLQSVLLNPAQPDPSWKIIGAHDIDGDGHTEILWRNTNGALAYWKMEGTNCTDSAVFNTDAAGPDWEACDR